MKPEEINALCTQTIGLTHALQTEFGRSIPLSALNEVVRQPIDKRLLATTLQQYHEGEGYEFPGEPDLWKYNCENLYIVWNDGRVEKSNQVDFRCIWNTTDSWSGEEVASCETHEQDEEIHPVASHFADTSDIKHLILLESRSSQLGRQQKKIESITIKIYTPTQELDITATAQEIMEIWEEGYGLQDYLNELS